MVDDRNLQTRMPPTVRDVIGGLLNGENNGNSILQLFRELIYCELMYSDMDLINYVCAMKLSGTLAQMWTTLTRDLISMLI